jgi:hypothetical protein
MNSKRSLMSFTEIFALIDSVNLKAPTASDSARRLTQFGRVDAVVALNTVERRVGEH